MNFRLREPYPNRIFKDAGNAFMMGTAGGFIWHYVKGLRNSPKLPNDPLARAWGAMFASAEFLVLVVRRKEDGWNVVASGFLVAAALQWRNGFRRSMMAGAFGAVFMSMFEGVGMLMQRHSEPPLGPGEQPGVSIHRTGSNRQHQQAAV